jgi:hypothetical protein
MSGVEAEAEFQASDLLRGKELRPGSNRAVAVYESVLTARRGGVCESRQS